MKILLNDSPHDLPASSSVADAVRLAALPHLEGVAVALNDSVVPRSEWSERRLAEGDSLLLIRASQGG